MHEAKSQVSEKTFVIIKVQFYISATGGARSSVHWCSSSRRRRRSFFLCVYLISKVESYEKRKKKNNNRHFGKRNQAAK